MKEGTLYKLSYTVHPMKMKLYLRTTVYTPYPVKVNGRFFEYRYPFEMNWVDGYTADGIPIYDYKSGGGLSIKGEIISVDPPRIKKEQTVKWPDGRTSVTEFIYELITQGVDINANARDSDGSVYKSVAIGTQKWMAENLNVEHYRNGDAIPQVQDLQKWSTLKTGAWCYYENKSENGKTFGKLYNWYAVNDSRGLAPKGWHIPTDAEWTQLTDYLGGEEVAGGKLKATILWLDMLGGIPSDRGTNNSTGFTALPAGKLIHRRFINPYTFTLFGTGSIFWSSSQNDTISVWCRTVSASNNVFRLAFSMGSGFPVRCIKDQ